MAPAAHAAPSGSALARSVARASAAQRTADFPAPQKKRDLWIDRLTQLRNGPGVLVAEPVATDAALASFGDGCGRWLHLIVGGQVEFSKTPLWSDLELTRGELGREDLRLTRAELATMAQRASLRLGMTDVALGEIRGTPKRVTLTYQWWSVATGKKRGAPLAITGSEAAVVAGLPKLAKQLCAAVGLASAHVPARVAESAADLGALGSWPRVPGEGEAGAVLPALTAFVRQTAPGAVAGKQPVPVLAVFLSMIYCGALRDVPRMTTFGKVLTQALPGNTQAYGEIVGRAARSGHATVAILPAKAVQEQLAHHRDNYLLYGAQHYLQALGGDKEQARSSMELAVRCSASNPIAWANLGKWIYWQANQVRRGRFLGKMTAEERQFCGQLYLERLPVTLREAELDTHYWASWVAVSEAAAFVGYEKMADYGMGRALALAPHRYEALAWGLQLYQPKWLDDRAKLEKVAHAAAVAAKSWNTPMRRGMAKNIYCAGLPDLVEPLLTAQERVEWRQALAMRQKRR
jgi:hypothetical protein